MLVSWQVRYESGSVQSGGDYLFLVKMVDSLIAFSGQVEMHLVHLIHSKLFGFLDGSTAIGQAWAQAPQEVHLSLSVLSCTRETLLKKP